VAEAWTAIGPTAWPTPWIVLAAAVAEAAVGYPDALHRRLPHPVVWLGGAISTLERWWNRPERPPPARRLLGIATVVLVAGAAWVAGFTLQSACARLPFGVVAVVAAGTLGLAQHSLYDHVAAVLRPLAAGDLDRARAAVGRIVGRDVAALDERGVAAAALESLAESFNDGVIAPMFWFALGGLGGLFAYKALNTADSLIGHKEPRWRDFGWAAARADDVFNLIPARLAGALIAAASPAAWRTMLRDAGKHASPNAGWPEAAMAGALGVRLGGAATYDGVRHDRPAFGDGGEPAAEDLRAGLRRYAWACAAAWAILAATGAAMSLETTWPR